MSEQWERNLFTSRQEHAQSVARNVLTALVAEPIKNIPRDAPLDVRQDALQRYRINNVAILDRINKPESPEEWRNFAECDEERFDASYAFLTYLAEIGHTPTSLQHTGDISTWIDTNLTEETSEEVVVTLDKACSLYVKKWHLENEQQYQ